MTLKKKFHFHDLTVGQEDIIMTELRISIYNILETIIIVDTSRKSCVSLCR